MDSITVVSNEKIETDQKPLEVNPDSITKIDSNENVKKVMNGNGDSCKSKCKGNNKAETSVKYSRIFKKVSPDGNLVRNFY